MKIRNGFVSNSSSSSFLIFGKWIDDAEELDRDKLEESGVFVKDEEESGSCVGVDTTEMKEDETLKQFKIRIALKLKELGVPAKPEDMKFIGGSEYR